MMVTYSIIVNFALATDILRCCDYIIIILAIIVLTWGAYSYVLGVTSDVKSGLL